MSMRSVLGKNVVDTDGQVVHSLRWWWFSAEWERAVTRRLVVHLKLIAQCKLI